MSVNGYSNPVIPGFFPDPSVTRVGEDYYLVTSSFEYFPGVPIFHSRDLVSWQQIGHVLTRKSQIDMASRNSSEGIYAPTIRYHNGLFYMVTTDVYGIGNFYVTASNPSGPWSDPIVLPYGNIDPSFMFDDNGKVYVTVQQGSDYDSHIIQYEIDPSNGKALCEPVVIFRGDEGPWVEGPHLYKINGAYYLIAASGGTGRQHREIAARSSQPCGPFELLSHPILTHSGLPEHPIQNVGHAELFEDQQGNWWSVFLGVRPVRGEYSILGRETFLAPVRWSEDGWPLIDYNEGLVQLEMPSDKRNKDTMKLNQLWRDDFLDETLSREWSFLRSDVTDLCDLIERKSWLALRGNAHTLNDAAPALFVCRRQQHIEMSASTLMSFVPIRDGQEAGLAARLSDKAHFDIALLREQGVNYLVCKQTDQGKTVETYRVQMDADHVYLAIHSTESQYDLMYSTNGSDWITADHADSAILSAERNWCFTGVCIGMYATGNGVTAASSAYFDYFQYES